MSSSHSSIKGVKWLEEHEADLPGEHTTAQCAGVVVLQAMTDSVFRHPQTLM